MIIYPFRKVYRDFLEKKAKLYMSSRQFYMEVNAVNSKGKLYKKKSALDNDYSAEHLLATYGVF